MSMKLPPALGSLLSSFGKPNSILVCEADGLTLRGAVLRRVEGQLHVDYTASTNSADLKQAVSEMIAELRQHGWQGKRAVLLTPAVMSALIELPVPADKPRSAIQMQELIRWELEPLMMQQNGYWTAGQILHALGYMDDAQIQEVLDRQRGKQKNGIGDGHGTIYAFKRFAELAVEMGFITQAQREECLTRQAWLRTDSDEISCGWVAQLAESEGEAAGDGQYPWLVSGVNTALMRHWEAAFAAHKVELTELYAMSGAAAGLLEHPATAVLIEPHCEHISSLRIEDGAVTAVRMQQSGRHSPVDACLEAYHAVTPPEPPRIFLADHCENEATLAGDLQSMTGREVLQLPVLAAELTHGMQGIAHDILLHGKTRFCGAIAVQGPKPPIWKQVEARAISAGVLMVGLIVITELAMQVRYELVDSRYQKVSAEKKSFDAAVAGVQAQIDAVKKARDEIKLKETELAKVMSRFDFFAVELPGRTAYVRNLLEELARSVNDDVVINVLEETPNMGIRIEGWALSEAAAQRFIQAFKDAMRPWGADVADPIVRAQAGRLGLLGYAMTFRLVESDELLLEEELPAEVEQSGVTP